MDLSNAIARAQMLMSEEYQNKMDAISVREVRGAEIVKELTGRNATVVADPTLLLKRNQWEIY